MILLNSEVKGIVFGILISI